eukprot:tig00000489_g1375.t1
MPPKKSAATAPAPGVKSMSIKSFFAVAPAKPKPETEPAAATPARAEPAAPEPETELTAAKKAPPASEKPAAKPAPSGGLEFASPPPPSKKTKSPARAPPAERTVEKKQRPAEEAARQEKPAAKESKPKEAKQQKERAEKSKEERAEAKEKGEKKEKKAKKAAPTSFSPIRPRRSRAASAAASSSAEVRAAADPTRLAPTMGQQDGGKKRRLVQAPAGGADEEEEYTGLEAIAALKAEESGEEGGAREYEVTLTADGESESEYSESSEEAASDSQESSSGSEESGSEASGASGSGSGEESDAASLVSEGEEEAPKAKRRAKAPARTPPASGKKGKRGAPGSAGKGAERSPAAKRGRLVKRAASDDEAGAGAGEETPEKAPAEAEEAAEEAEAEAAGQEEAAEQEEAGGEEAAEQEGDEEADKYAQFAFTQAAGRKEGPGKRSAAAQRYIASQRGAPVGDDRARVSIAAGRAAKFEAANQERYSWLADERDAQGRRPGEEGYDASTLRVPADKFAKLSDFEKQYWTIKKDNWDKVVFFKKGKFYELYEKDADVGHRELDLKLTDRVNMRMCGVPESTFEMWAAKLVARGYKVVRVEQMERLRDADRRRAQGGGKETKVCQREVCGVLTAGTLVEEAMIASPEAVYLLALREARLEGPAAGRRFGVCVVDAARGEFAVGSFEDDAALSALETLLLQLQPRELVYERANLSPEARRMLRRLPRAVASETPPAKAPAAWCPEAARDRLRTGGYFADPAPPPTVRQPAGPRPARGRDGARGAEAEWPEALREAMGEPLAGAAFAGCLSYLREVLRDEALVSARRFRPYDPRGEAAAARHLVLDGKVRPATAPPPRRALGRASGAAGQALANLEVLEGGASPAVAVGAALDAGTARRAAGEEIEDRLDAVEDLHALAPRHGELRALLKSLPDLERGIARAHAGARRSTYGVMFDNSEVKRLRAFLDLLAALRKALVRPRRPAPPRPAPRAERGGAAQEVPALLAKEAAGFKSRRLRALATLGDAFPTSPRCPRPARPPAPPRCPGADGGGRGRLEEVARGFDLQAARKEGSPGLVPEAGTVPEYEAAAAEVAALEGRLEEILRDARRRLKCPALAFRTMGKEEYLLEVPAQAARDLPTSWSEASSTKAVKRYEAAEVKALLGPLAEARDRRETAQADLLRLLMGRFSAHGEAWRAAVAALAEIDCLLALSLASFGLEGPMCRPRLVEAGQGGPVLRLKGSRHPCVVPPAGQPFIPNDIALGGDGAPPVALVTGPNMGGKSTLLRQACVAVVMAQVGCFVPAEECVLSPVDRLFTRIGAADRILAGESTFAVELHETAGVLRHATQDSLVILDELGRGTLTFDGVSIAHAVLHTLAASTRCRTLFSTHYHMLTDWVSAPGSEAAVGLYHMQSLVEDSQRRVTFLYKFAAGAREAALDEGLERCKRALRAAAAGDAPALRAALARP